MEINLKRCPFCGGRAFLYVNGNGVRVKCEECAIQTPIFNDTNMLVWPDKLAVEHVTNIWNQRVAEKSEE